MLLSREVLVGCAGLVVGAAVGVVLTTARPCTVTVCCVKEDKEEAIEAIKAVGEAATVC